MLLDKGPGRRGRRAGRARRHRRAVCGAPRARGRSPFIPPCCCSVSWPARAAGEPLPRDRDHPLDVV